MTGNLQMPKSFIDHAVYRLRDDYMPKVRQCLDELSEEDLWWRPNDNSNSAGNILLHLSGNIRQWIIHGVGGVEDCRERDKEFAERGPLPKTELLDRLDRTVNEAYRVLEAFETSRLMEPRTIQGYDETCLTVIFHVVEHFAQHLGQLSYITKLRCDLNLEYFDL